MFLVFWLMIKSFHREPTSEIEILKKKKNSGDIPIIIIILFSLFCAMLSLYVKLCKAIKNVSRDWKFTPS